VPFIIILFLSYPYPISVTFRDRFVVPIMARTRIITADSLTGLFLIKYRMNPNNVFLGIMIVMLIVMVIIILIMLIVIVII
jgi:hypothetical protein